MNRRRITIHDYPEHLNPFYEKHLPADNKNDKSKYGTWGSNSRTKIRQAILEPTWIEALNLSPAKKKVSKKWSLFKTQAVEKFQRARSKSNAFEHKIQRPPDRRELPALYIRPHRQFSERLPSSSTPVKHESNVWTNVVDLPEQEEKYTLQGAKPKIRKKRAAPTPPNLSPESEVQIEIGNWNMSDSIDSGIQQSPANEEIEAIESDLSTTIDTHTETHSDKIETTTIKPLIEQPNIAILVSNNLTL